jgi:hypothetical protein
VPPQGYFSIGLEMGLLFEAREEELQSMEDIGSFRCLMAKRYNQTVEKIYPRLVADIKDVVMGEAAKV